MIDGAFKLAWLLMGLGSIEAAGYAVLVLLVPRGASLAPLERLTLAFGLGGLGITLWMLTLTFLQVLYTLPVMAGPWLLVTTLGLWRAGQRGWLQEDGRTVLRGVKTLLTLGVGSRLARLDRILLIMLLAAFGFALLRAISYPLWAWDSLATWGLKAKAFYLAQGVDLSRFEAHNYYPNLTPLLMAYLYFWLGGVSDHLVKALFTVWGGMLVVLLFALLRRLGVARTEALGATAYVVLNGATFLVHLFIAYADLALAYYQLAAAGWLYLWLREEAPRGSGPLLACLCGGMIWSKYEGWPLVLIMFLAAGLTLLWLRPPGVGKRLTGLLLMLLGGWCFSIPWRLFVGLQGLEAGVDHIGGFYPHQFFLGAWSLLQALVWIPYFGLFWPTVFLCLILAGRSLWQTPALFWGLFVGGNLAAIVLAFALVPASPAEFPLYVRATVDRLLLHISPASALACALPLTARGPSPPPPP